MSEILSRLSDGWSMEQVSTLAAREKEAQTMGNRVGSDAHPLGSVLLSLRDPKGIPHANIVLMYGQVVAVLGRDNSRVDDPELQGRLREYFEAQEHKTWYCMIAGLRNHPEGVPDVFGVCGGPQVPYRCLDGFILGEKGSTAAARGGPVVRCP